MRVVQSALLYFACVFGTGFVLGAVRVPFLVPRLGVRTAELLEMPLMFLAILLAARYAVRRFALPPTAMVRLPVGFIALALLVSAELILAVVLQGRAVGDYVASRDPVSGSVYLVGLFVFALMPALLALGRASAIDPVRRQN